MSKDQRSSYNGNCHGSQHNGGPGTSQTGPVSLIITGVPLNGEHQLLMP